MLVEGDKAPNFTLISDDENEVSLKDYLGKKVVLYFYPKDGTPGCTQEAKDFRDLHMDFENKGVVILGISKDTVESHKKFKNKHQLPFKILSDTNGDVLNLYGVWKKKTFYGKTFLGVERTSFLINEKGIIKKIYHKVKYKGHAQTCLNDFSQIE